VELELDPLDLARVVPTSGYVGLDLQRLDGRQLLSGRFGEVDHRIAIVIDPYIVRDVRDGAWYKLARQPLLGRSVYGGPDLVEMRKKVQHLDRGLHCVRLSAAHQTV